MADPFSVLVGVTGLLSSTIKASEQILRLRDQPYNVRQLKLDVDVSLQKLDVWQNTYSGDGNKHRDVSGEALWGTKGWMHVRRMLSKISEICQHISDVLEALKKNEEIKPRSRWLKAYKAVQQKQGPSLKMKKMQDLSNTLTRTVDELWIYSETVFDSLHGTLASEPQAPERDRLLDAALRSRPCSLELYSSCSKSTLNCSIEMNLLDFISTNRKALPAPTSDIPLPVFYHLIARSRESRALLQKMTIESVDTPTVSKAKSDQAKSDKAESDNFVLQDMENLRLFKPDTDNDTIIHVAARGSAKPCDLRIPKGNIQPISLESNPESLAKVLGSPGTADLSTKEHISTNTKVEIAYMVIQSGFFLLGTPWFASLSSKNLLRLKNNDDARYSFCLETQTLDLEHLLYDDPGALAEPSQLFRLGVLLMEIALDEPDLYSRSGENGQEANRISKLPLVEQSMGQQYCKATAFCLQYRQAGEPFKGKFSKENKSPGLDKPYQEADKYQDSNFDDWQDYLKGLLQQFHSQVYLRIQALREVENNFGNSSRESL